MEILCVGLFIIVVVLLIFVFALIDDVGHSETRRVNEVAALQRENAKLNKQIDGILEILGD